MFRTIIRVLLIIDWVHYREILSWVKIYVYVVLNLCSVGIGFPFQWAKGGGKYTHGPIEQMNARILSTLTAFHPSAVNSEKKLFYFCFLNQEKYPSAINSKKDFFCFCFFKPGKVNLRIGKPLQEKG